MESWTIALIIVVILMLFFQTILFFTCYRKCPSDKIMVIYGKLKKDADGNQPSVECIHGGAKFVWPIIQQYQFLDLNPISIDVNIKKALNNGNFRFDIESRFTVGISTEPNIMQNAAERLLGLRQEEIAELARDIIRGQLRLVIALSDTEMLMSADRDILLDMLARNVEYELKKIGLRLINLNIEDITENA